MHPLTAFVIGTLLTLIAFCVTPGEIALSHIGISFSCGIGLALIELTDPKR